MAPKGPTALCSEYTGLHYNLFRYYGPVAGRFTQVGPTGLASGLNIYAYVGDPLTWVDPLGLTKCSLLGNIIREANKVASSGGAYYVFTIEYIKREPSGSAKA